MRRTRVAAVALGALLLSGVTTGLAGAAPTWLVYHADSTRTGVDRGDGTLVPTSLAWRAALDGNVYAQPLVVAGRVIAVTENNSVYALDGHDGHVLWRRHLGTPMTNVVSQVGCGDIDPLGITSTPVINAVLNNLFVVEAVQDRRNVIHHELVELDVTTGAVRLTANVDPGSPQNPLYIQQRAGLAIGNGRIYVGFGGYAGDCGPYHGWLVSVDQTGHHKVAFDVTPHDGLGAIWETGGPAIDAAGNVYVGTGNNDPNVSTHDYGESVLKLDPTLHVLHNFSGSNATDDEDFGTTTPALVGGNMVVEVGKQHVGYLLDSRDLHEIEHLTVCPSSEAKGADAFDGSNLFVPCDAGIQQVHIDVAHRSMSLGWTGPATAAAGPPMLAGGSLWFVDWGNARLYALNPSTGAPRAGFPISIDATPHFAAPSAALGLILVGTNRGVSAYVGPAGPPTHALGAPRSVRAQAGQKDAVVTWTAPSNPPGAPVTGYVVTPFVAGTAQARRTFRSTATRQTIAGLNKNKTYRFRVAALNRQSTGPLSGASNAVVIKP